MTDVVQRRRVAEERVPIGGDVGCFDTRAAEELTAARLGHLASLGLPLMHRSVLEVGAGVGHLTGFFTSRGCRVLATEARPENLDELRRRRPGVTVAQADVEETLRRLGRFDVVFCYGLLYHLENPLRALRNMAEVCDDLLLIETIVCDAPAPVLRLDDETKAVNQALRGVAHRPSPSYVALALNRIGFEHVYGPTRPPAHPEYEFEFIGDLNFTREGRPLRAVFVASRRPLDIPDLNPLLSDE
jgi:SAM-dependent methyltransferase